MSQQDREPPKKMAPEDIALLGLSLGRYQIVDFCAKGSVATTFRGSEISSDRTVAVKILKKSPSTDYFMAHSTRLKELDHPAITKVYDIAFEQQCDGYYVISQWIDGSNLKDTLAQQGRLALQDALIVIVNIAHALDYAHNRGVVHGNLKTSNILFTADGETMVTGFGLVPIYRQEQGQPPTWGTEDFMAPEQFQGALPGFTGDMYSLGCIFWQLITGMLPKRQAGEFPVQDELDSAGLKIHDDMVACLQKMLAYEPARRFASMGEITEELERIYSLVQTVECPLCGKQNSIKEVFKCYECEVANLCLSHLRPEKQCCERCYGHMQASVTQQMIKPSAANRLKLTAFLEHICKHELKGLLVLASKTSMMGINIGSEGIELCLEKMPEGIHKDSPLKSEEAFYQGLAKFLTWKEFSFEFWEGKNPARVIPQAKVRIISAEKASEFLSPFCRLLQVWNEIQEEGGLYFYGKGMSCGTLFTKKGVMVISPVPENGKATTVLTTERTMLWVLQSLFRAPWERVEYCTEHSFPNEKMHIPLPLEDFRRIATDRAMWTSLLAHIPTVDALLPPTLQWNKPFGGMELTTLAQNVYRKLYDSLRKIGNLGKSTSALTATLIKIAIAKKRLRQISDILVEMAQNHSDKWEAQTTETILLQTEKLFPDHTEASQLLAEFYEYVENSEKAASYYAKAGNIHWKNKEDMKAVACYQQAIELGSQLVMPRLRLIKFYDKANQKEKIKKIADSTWNIWQNVKKENRDVSMDTMAKVCQILIKQDCASGACYWELANIMLMKGQKKAALKQFEAMIPIYRKEHNKQGQVKAMAYIAQLKPENAKILEKLEIMQGKDWKKLLRSPEQSYAFSGIKTQPTNLSLLKIYFGKSPAIKFAIIACVGLLVAAIVVPMFFILPVPGIRNLTMQSHTQKRIQPRLQQNHPRIENDEKQEKQRQWRELWRKAQRWKEEKKYSLARNSYEKILAAEDNTWRKKASEEIALLDKIVAMPLIDQQTHYRQALDCQEQGLYADAMKKYQQACKITPTSAIAIKARGKIKWLKDKEEQTLRLLGIVQSLVSRGRYAEAVDNCYRVLNDKYMIHCKAAEGLAIPLIVETSPVLATLSADSRYKQKSIGKNLLVYHQPGMIPEIQVEYKGFKESKRHFQKSLGGHAWKMEIILQYVPLWEFPAKGAIGPIVQDNDILYFGSRDQHVYGVDTAGKKQLDFSGGGSLDDITGGLLVTEKNIYFATHTGRAFAINKKNSLELWSIKLGNATIHSTPCTSGPYLCFTLENGLMWFVEKNNSDSRWKYSLKNKCLNSPVKYAKDRIVAATYHGKIFALRPARKKVEWKRQAKWDEKSVKLLAGPTVVAKRIYVVSERGQIIGWDFRGKKRLEIKTEKNLMPLLIADQKYILVADQQNGIHCWERDSGKAIWNKTLSYQIKHLLMQKDTLYVTTKGKELLAMNTKTAKLLWIYQTDKMLDSQPFIYQNTLYAANKDGTLQAYNLEH